MAKTIMVACPTCGQHVADQAAHDIAMTERRLKFGAGWGLDSLHVEYHPLADNDEDDVVAGAGQHDQDEADNGS